MGKIKIVNGATRISDGTRVMTAQPRSFMDKLLGRSTANYSRVKPSMKFKAKPSSNGIGVGY